MKTRVVLSLLVAFLMGGPATESAGRGPETLGPEPPDAEEALIEANRLLEDAGEDAGRLMGAERVYLKALETATGSTRLEALNNYSVLLLRSGDPAEALDVLTSLEKHAPVGDPSDCENRAVLIHNIGGALEEMDRAPEALSTYFRAFDACPRFRPALEEALHLAWQRPQLRSESDVVVAALERLLEQRSFSTAEEIFHKALTQSVWLKAASNEGLFKALMKYFSRASLSSTEFREKNWPDTLEGACALAAPEDARWIEWISSGYEDSLPVVLDAKAVSGLPSPWNEAPKGGDVLLSFLGMLGDRFVEEGEEHRALERYALAWSLDPGSFESALGLSSLLASSSKDLDPSGRMGNAVLVHFHAAHRTRGAQESDNLRQLEDLLQEAAVRHGRKTLWAAGIH